MWFRISLLLTFSVIPLMAWEQEYSVENSNFTLSVVPYGEEERVWYNYNRVRFNYTLREGNWYVSFICDADNYYSKHYIQSDEYTLLRTLKADTPFDIETDSHTYDNGELFGRVHRLNIGYADEKHNIILGLQKISLGVGRIWTPTDLFNSRNPLTLEPDQIYGAFGLSYTYTFSTTGQMMVVVSQRADDSYKYAARVKQHFEGVGDIALSFFSGNDAQMIAYEIEGDLADTGIEWHSEGGYLKDKLLDTSFFQGVLGVDYAFNNGLTLSVEYLYSSATYTPEEILEYRNSSLGSNRFTSNNYIGSTAAYEFNLLWSGSVTMIYSFGEQSIFASPVVNYSLGDETTVSLGALLYGGNGEAAFGSSELRYYLNLKTTF